MSDPITSQYTPRDISWLQFNHRVLQEAADPQVPLYERIKFLAIYSSNLDEFYRVRVASLRSFKQLKKSTRKLLQVKPRKELKAIQKVVNLQQQLFGRIWRNELIPTLEKHGIRLLKPAQFSPEQHKIAHEYYLEHVQKEVTPVWLDEQEETPFLKNKGLYLLLAFADEEQPKLLLLNIPSDTLPRFIQFPKEEAEDTYDFCFLDDLIRSQIEHIVPDRQYIGSWAIKLSRDAELYIEDEYEGDLIEKIKTRLSERSVGLPTRFLYDESMSDSILKQVRNYFGLSKYDLVPGARYHNFNDFFAFPDPLSHPDWHDKPLPPLPHPELEEVDNLLEAIAEKDYLLHFPYQKFDYVTRFIREASEDKEVVCIKITLYRVAGKSEVGEALLNALAKGKKVLVFIEAKARFDEASNLQWGEKLAEAGAKVIYSFPNIKVHTKLLMVEKQVGQEKRHLAYIGTGNFNEKTAKIYADHALLTANPKIVDEVVQVFDLLERKFIMPKTKRVLISPFTTRSGFSELIEREIKAAKAGQTAYMILKMNSLEDPGMIDLLYRASQAGVKVRMIVRGICCLVPGIPGLSENIEITSIIDRFLEHARIYIFANNGKEKMYIASADWMTRNLDRRIEVAVPILDEEIYSELRRCIDIQLRDTTKARRILDSGENPYVKRNIVFDTNGNVEYAEEPVRAQEDFYRLLAEKQIPVDKL